MVIGTITRESVHNVSVVFMFSVVVLTLINSGIQKWYQGRTGEELIKLVISWLALLLDLLISGITCSS